MNLPHKLRPDSVRSDGILPVQTSENAPFWTALRDNRLVGQFCSACDQVRFPIAPICPSCGDGSFGWRALAGTGTIFSWVRYHRPYLPEFAALVPYVVALVELKEGIRMFGRYVSAIEPDFGMPVQLVVEHWVDGGCVPTFAAIGEDA